MNVQLLADHLVDVVPMVLLEVRVSQRHDDGHCQFKFVDVVLKLGLDGVGIKSAFETLADLCVVG